MTTESCPGVGASPELEALSGFELAELYQGPWKSKATAIFRAMRIDASDREDLAQDAFLVFLRRRKDVWDPEAYFMQVLRRRCLRHRRETLPHLPLEPAHSESLTKPTADPLCRLYLERLIAHLNEDERRLLHSRFVAGKRHAELAQEFGVKPESMRRKLLRIVDKLRDIA